MLTPNRELLYFTHLIEGAKYGGWYRLLPGDCIEVLAPGLMHTALLDGRSAQIVACLVLEEFVRARLRQGAPVPIAIDIPESESPDHHCSDVLLGAKHPSDV